MKFWRQILAITGVSTIVTACYGTPYAEYEISGRVTDTNGNSIPDISVRINTEFGDYQNTFTDKKGKYELENDLMPMDIEGSLLIFEDVDGEANGRFKSDTVKLKESDFIKKKEGSGWSLGEFEATINATLKEVKD